MQKQLKQCFSLFKVGAFFAVFNSFFASATTQFVMLIFPFLCVLIAVAFYTLLERKVLGYIMNRKGPNKVAFMGMVQPFSDAAKLFNKESITPGFSNNFVFVLCPSLILFNSLALWVLYPFNYSEMMFICGLIQFLVVSSMSAYGVMLAGWSSNSKYALLGSVRAVAQSVSYEVPLTLVMISVCCSLGSMWCQEVKEIQDGLFSLGFLLDMEGMIWLICMLAESNRAPFDFVEGESELVSGFNVEYSSGGFAMVFMAEYASMLFNSLFFCVLFIGGSGAMLMLATTLVALGYVWVRGSFPRMRYDKMMNLCWRYLTGLTLCLSVFCMCSLYW
uniref:NADH-ubiquinone oxidoreductase chain 1 n=1 Tax=Arcuatula senhousia TaxID=1954227 RepID=E2DHX1_ARCSE|nr:NADH dehydrogenase subunit 1 [Arcuatula senhousia]ACY00232.1 NADH dehydrogenase subunit 1 [Arcuatula senhousia]